MTRELYLTADMADALAAAGLKCRTPAAVRSAVEDGRLSPDLESPRGVKAWTREALARDVAAMWRAQRMRTNFGRQALRQPQQLQLGGG
jgi:hypothetical protein